MDPDILLGLTISSITDVVKENQIFLSSLTCPRFEPGYSLNVYYKFWLRREKQDSEGKVSSTSMSTPTLLWNTMLTQEKLWAQMTVV